MVFRSACLLTVSSASAEIPYEGTEQTGLLQKRSREHMRVFEVQTQVAQVAQVAQAASKTKAVEVEISPQLSKLFQSASKLLRTGATNETLDFAKDTLAEIEKKVLPAITSGHQADLKELGELFAAFTPIQSSYGEATESLNDMRNTEQSLSTQHKDCRKQEHGQCGAFTTCTTELQALNTTYKAKKAVFKMNHDNIAAGMCGTAPQPWAVFPPSKYDADDAGSYNWEFKEKLDSYTESGGEYFLAKDMYDNKTVTCTAQKSVFKGKTEECNSLKKNLELSSCASFSKHSQSLEVFSASWKSQTGALESATKAVKELEKDRKVEFRSIKSVECLLKRIGEGGGLPCDETTNEADKKIAACRAMDVSTSWLDITYPEVPEEPVKADDAAYPCNDNFITQEYGNFTDRTGTSGELKCGVSTGVAEPKWTEILLLPECDACITAR